MERKHNFKELLVWQKAMALVKNIFVLLSAFPKEERFELVGQMRRSAISIPSNIAEGSGRNSDKEFCRFLDIAISSAFELETQLIISSELKYLAKNEFEKISSEISEIQKMIYGLRKSLVKSKN